MPLLPISLIEIDEFCVSKMCDKEDSEKTSYPSLSRCLLAIIYDSILLIPVLLIVVNKEEVSFEQERWREMVGGWIRGSFEC